MIYILDFRGADVGGPVVPGRIVRYRVSSEETGSEDDLRLESTVTFLLHGFNVTRKAGIAGLMRLAKELRSAQTGGIVAVLWPGDHWTNAISFPFEGKDADDTAVELTRFIDRTLPAGTEISFVSHSLGARVVMETVERLVGRAYPIRQISMMAAAIDDYSLASPENYRRAVETVDRVAVLASRHDLVLRLAYPVGDLIQAFLFWPDDSGLALGYHGPKPFRNNSISGRVHHEQIPDFLRVGHDDYIPGGDPTPAQLSAARFTDQTLQGVRTLAYSP